MIKITTRAALLGSATALVFSVAHAQDDEQVEGDVNPEACADLSDRLADDSEIGEDLRIEVEDVISTGDTTQCHLVLTAWEDEGLITEETMTRVATDEATERMIVQQEVEVDADAAVYQPPAEVEVDAGAPEVTWTMPRQTVTVEEEAPEITVRQGRPTISVEIPQPRVNVTMPEPEIIVNWHDPTVDLSEVEPTIEVNTPEPTVNVNIPEPVVEVTIGGEAPTGLVELEDGRFAPEGSTADDLEPNVTINQSEAEVRRGGEAEAPEIRFNRADPELTVESEEPEVTVQNVGEPDVQISTDQEQGESDAETAEEDESSQEDDTPPAEEEESEDEGDEDSDAEEENN